MSVTLGSIEFRLLGPLEVVSGGRRLEIGSARQRAILAALALRPNRVVPRDTLVEEIWGEAPPASATATLHSHVSRLRRTLAEGAGGASAAVLRTREPGYVLEADPDCVDAHRFEKLAAQARDCLVRGEDEVGVRGLRQALALWRGEPLLDLPDARYARLEAERLEEARRTAMEDLADAELACGRPGEAVALLEPHLAANPFRERGWGQLMLALYRLGRQADALNAYQRVQTLLSEEMGLGPTPALRRLEEQVLHQSPELDLEAPVSSISTIAQPLRGRRASSEPAVPLPALLTGMGRIFVGRDEQLARLQQLWDEARTGELRAVLVVGEPGVGKTRLAAELAARVHEQGATVLAGRCDEDMGVPYQPFVEALRYLVGHTPAEGLGRRLGRHGGELARLVLELTEHLPALPPPLRSDPETERFRLFDAVASLLADTSTEEPLLLVLDDLQWAAKPTLLLLRHVLQSVEPMRLLAVVTYRDTEIGRAHPLSELLADLRRQTRIERIALSGLDISGVAAFLEQAAGHHELGAAAETNELARAIHLETEGNVFFVREVVRHLIETGGVREQNGRWMAGRPVEELGIPAGVRDVVGRRLNRLSETANRVLALAAVTGQEFELAVLGRAGGLDEELLVSALDEALAARLVAEVSGPATRYRFAHALVRATLYEELTGARRVILHRRVAEATEAVHVGALDDHLPALAHHYARASATAAAMTKAVAYAARAGDRALSQLANDEAASYYRSALELLGRVGGRPDEARRLELLISLGEAQRRAGDPAYRQTLLDAAHLAAQIGDALALARAALANTQGHVWTGVLQVDADRVEMLEAAIAAVGQDDLRLRSRLLATLGLELAWERDPRHRLTLSDEALRMARSLGHPETLAHALLARDYTIHAPDNATERFTATTELLATAERLGDPVLASRALSLRFKVAMELADVAEAERCLARNQSLVIDLGQPALTWATMHHHATLRVLHGDSDAEAAIIAAHEFGVTANRPDIILSVSQRLSLYLEQGRLGELEECVRQLAERTQYPMIKAIYASILAETGQMEAAAGRFDDLAATGFAHPTNNVAWLHFVTDCAWLSARLGRGDCVPTLRSMLAPYADQLVVASFAGWVTGSVAFYLGLLCTTIGEWPEAEAYFTAAAGTHKRVGAATWLARTRLEWARMLLARAEPKDDERAHDLLHEALATSRELGLANIERGAVELLSSR